MHTLIYGAMFLFYYIKIYDAGFACRFLLSLQGQLDFCLLYEAACSLLILQISCGGVALAPPATRTHSQPAASKAISHEIRR